MEAVLQPVAILDHPNRKKPGIRILIGRLLLSMGGVITYVTAIGELTGGGALE